MSEQINGITMEYIIAGLCALLLYIGLGFAVYKLVAVMCEIKWKEQIKKWKRAGKK